MFNGFNANVLPFLAEIPIQAASALSRVAPSHLEGAILLARLQMVDRDQKRAKEELLPGNHSEDFPEHARRCLAGIDRLDQLRSIAVEDRLCFGLISLQPFPDDDFIGIVEAVVLERAFLETLGQPGAVGTG